MQSVLGNHLFLYQQSQQCRGANLSPWEIWVLIISGKRCAEADNFSRQPGMLRSYTGQCKENTSFVLEFFASMRPPGAAVRSRADVFHTAAFLWKCLQQCSDMWWMFVYVRIPRGQWDCFLFFLPLFFYFFIYFPFFSFKWMKILKITSLYLTYWWDIWSPMVVRWMSVGQEYLMRCWHRVPREAMRSLSL